MPRRFKTKAVKPAKSRARKQKIKNKNSKRRKQTIIERKKQKTETGQEGGFKKGTFAN